MNARAIPANAFHAVAAVYRADQWRRSLGKIPVIAGHKEAAAVQDGSEVSRRADAAEVDGRNRTADVDTADRDTCPSLVSSNHQLAVRTASTPSPIAETLAWPLTAASSSSCVTVLVRAPPAHSVMNSKPAVRSGR